MTTAKGYMVRDPISLRELKRRIPDLMSRRELVSLISKEMGWRQSKRRGRRK